MAQRNQFTEPGFVSATSARDVYGLNSSGWENLGKTLGIEVAKIIRVGANDIRMFKQADFEKAYCARYARGWRPTKPTQLDIEALLARHGYHKKDLSEKPPRKPGSGRKAYKSLPVAVAVPVKVQAVTAPVPTAPKAMLSGDMVTLSAESLLAMLMQFELRLSYLERELGTKPGLLDVSKAVSTADSGEPPHGKSK